MSNQDKILITLLLILAMSFIALFRVSQEDIKDCVSVTGWSKDKCQERLIR